VYAKMGIESSPQVLPHKHCNQSASFHSLHHNSATTSALPARCPLPFPPLIVPLQ
jgi:hypothetical protein